MKFQETEEFKRAIEKTYKNCIPKYFETRNNKIVPFLFVKSKIFGNKLINLPFLDTGFLPGDIAKEDIGKIISQSDNNIIEIRTDESFENFDQIKKILVDSGFKSRENKYQMIISLEGKNIEKIFWEFKRHTRRDIRTSEKKGLTTKRIKNEGGLKEFYRIYLKNMREFGTPQHNFNFFKNLFSEMRGTFFGMNCYYKNKAIGSIIMFYSGEGYMGFNVSDFNYRKCRPNDKLYWEMIKFGIENKLRKISLGQVDLESEDPRARGLYNFKSKWLAKPIKRVYFYYPKKDKLAGNKKDKLKKFRIIWRRMPLFLTKLIGPKIASQLGL